MDLSNESIEFDLALEDAEAELAAIEAELNRRRHAREPKVWAEERLGDTLWSVQVAILNSLRDHRKTAVRSCHGAGKSFTAAIASGHWIDTNPLGDAFLVTSAPTGPQVRAILWREIGRVHARGQLAGRVNQTEWIIPVGGREELAGFGRKPSDYDPTAFQGIHAVAVLVIFDEADGIPEQLWDAADSLIANDESRMLAIGNPDNPDSYFKQICEPGSGWNVIEISAFITPNFTGEYLPERAKKQLVGPIWVEEKRKKWAAQWTWTPDMSRCVPPLGVDDRNTHPYWQSKVLGRFPTVGEDPGLIPVAWIKRAQEYQGQTGVEINVLGVDVGGGGDSSTIALRRGQVVRIVHEDRNPDTMQTAGKVVHTLVETKAESANIDVIGIGRGVVDRLKEQDLDVEGVNVGEKPYEDLLKMVDGVKVDEEGDSFVNLRAQLWWMVRTAFEKGEIDIDPNDDELEEQLAGIRFKRTSSGKIQIESKDEAKRRGLASPNRADALMLTFARTKPKDTLYGEAVW